MIPNIYTYDDIVRTLLTLHKAGFESALIAGGAVRDLYYEILPTDIDIYVWDPVYSKEKVWECSHFRATTEYWKQLFKLRGLEASRSPYIRDTIEPHKDDSAYETAGGTITGVWDMLKMMIPFQIITITVNPKVYVNEYFDIGLCKAYCDGVKFRYTPDFMRDMRDKTLTICGRHMTIPQMSHTWHNHVPKLQHKFPGYQVKLAPWNRVQYRQVVARNQKP